MATNFWIKNILFPSKKLRIFNFVSLALTRKWGEILKMKNGLQ